VVDRVNATLASFQTLKRLYIVADEWTVDTGELTPSMKLKRPVVEQRYATAIARFYQDDGSAQR
jgi:long-chain acyl-CoA synthetase